VQKKVEILSTGAVASDDNPYILSTGLGVEDSLTNTAAADDGWFRSGTEVHLGVYLTRGKLAARRC